MREYWQKRPLLLRQALPGYAGPLTVPSLLELAQRDDVESRIVRRIGQRWTVDHGPFTKMSACDRGAWTLLVQGVNLHLAAGDALLRRFDFISQARLDDLMISYASPGGGVGPHVDSYDVFLLQTLGRRRWRISSQTDHTLVPGAALKILKDFRVEQEWILEPGDMLYLPPHYAHDGTALDACTTCSIGFRAPAHDELMREFFYTLAEGIEPSGRYSDAGRQPTRTPARMDDHMVDTLAAKLAAVRWSRADVAAFLASHLSEPKPQVFFDHPKSAMSVARFTASARRRGLRLHPKTVMLYTTGTICINGEDLAKTIPAHALTALREPLHKLANERKLDDKTCQRYLFDQAALPALLQTWHAHGWITLA